MLTECLSWHKNAYKTVFAFKEPSNTISVSATWKSSMVSACVYACACMYMCVHMCMCVHAYKWIAGYIRLLFHFPEPTYQVTVPYPQSTCHFIFGKEIRKISRRIYGPKNGASEEVEELRKGVTIISFHRVATWEWLAFILSLVCLYLLRTH